MVAAIPVTLYYALQEQDTRTSASEISEDTVIMVIDGQKVTKAQIRDVAEEHYDPTAIDQQALLDAKEILEERKILDIAASNYGITPDQDRIDRFKLEDLSDTQAKYEALRQQVILKTVNSIEALSIGFWNPPLSGINSLTAQEQAAARTQLAVGIPVLTQIENRMKAGEDALEIADDILADNQELEPVLAVNGYIFAPLTDADRAISSYPLIYEWGDNSLDSQTRNFLFTLAQNAVGKSQNTPTNRGGSVFRVITRGNQNGSSTYGAWLTEQKASLVQDVSSL